MHPLVPLSTEDQVERFFDTRDEVYPGDYKTLYFKNSNAPVPKIDTFYSSLKYKTRVICFFFDKDEYKTEIKNLR